MPDRPKRPGRGFRRGPRLTAMALPRPGDILRGEPNLIQGAAAETVGALRRAVAAYNGERVQAGQRPIDMPGLIHYPKRSMQVRPSKPGAGFRPEVRLDTSRVRDLRGVEGPVDMRNPIVPTGPVPRRSGTSSNRTPTPNQRAIERANPRARFKRT